jgi:hypothetical protein
MLAVGVIRIYFLLVICSLALFERCQICSEYPKKLGHLHDFLKAYIASSTMNDIYIYICMLERKQLGRNNERALK